jgi:hydrogenase expression/formation protein HypC
MCLSSVGKILKITKDTALVDLNGARKEVSATLKPAVKKGDYVLIHAGFIIEVMNPKEAKKVIKDIDETQNL